MPIPEMNQEGFLPVGVHDCTFAELQATFGQNRWKADPDSERQRQVHCPQRERLCAKLGEYIGALAAAGLEVDVVVDIVVDGSFTTAKPDPSDIDLIVVPSDYDLSNDPPWPQERLLYKPHYRLNGYKFDIKVVQRGSSRYDAAVRDWQRVRGRNDVQKGLLRVRK